MTAAIESLSLSKLEERRDTLLRYVAVVEEEIQIRKANSSDSSLFKLFTSFKRTEDSKQSSNSKKVDEVKKAKDTKKVEEVKKAKDTKKVDDVKKPKKIKIKKVESGTTEIRKIKATIPDMKAALDTNSIKYKSSIDRPELEELVRHNNLVRVSEKINTTRKSNK
jgi:hypothetical protein